MELQRAASPLPAFGVVGARNDDEHSALIRVDPGSLVLCRNEPLDQQVVVEGDYRIGAPERAKPTAVRLPLLALRTRALEKSAALGGDESPRSNAQRLDVASILFPNVLEYSAQALVGRTRGQLARCRVEVIEKL